MEILQIAIDSVTCFDVQQQHTDLCYSLILEKMLLSFSNQHLFRVASP